MSGNPPFCLIFKATRDNIGTDIAQAMSPESPAGSF